MKHLRPRGLQPHAWAITRLLRIMLRSLARWKVFNVTVTNREAVPQKGRVIVACNHISIADPVFLWGALRRNGVALAMAELWRIPGVNLIMWLLGHIPVKRGNLKSRRQALTAGAKILEHDGLLIIYPEGKCSETGELLPFRPGVAELALATDTKIVPAFIEGSDKVKPLRSWKLRRKYPVHLRFGDPIEPHMYAGTDNERKALLSELRYRMSDLSRG